jgi:hypothetical protein
MIPAKLLIDIREAIRTGNVALLAAVMAEMEAA